MSISSTPAAVRFALSEGSLGLAEPAPWIGPLVALGTRAARYAQTLSGKQLIIVISVPMRDFAATLIGCGWMLAKPAPQLANPLDVMRGLAPRTPIRMTTDKEVISGYFQKLDERMDPARLYLGNSQWLAHMIRALAVLPELDSPERQTRPVPGSVSCMARLNETWDERLCSPSRDLAIIGTLAWLRQDISALLSKEVSGLQLPDQISSILLPKGKHTATWSTRLYASAGFADDLPLPKELEAVVLDGAGAIRYISEIEAPVVCAILDRSIADETAAEILVQVRNTGSEPLSVRADLRWPPPAGIEALAFTVPL